MFRRWKRPSRRVALRNWDAILAVTDHQVTKTTAQKRIKIAQTATSELLP
jgi:hypothetical protein